MKMTRKNFLQGISAVGVMGWRTLLAENLPFGAGARVPDGRIRRLLERALGLNGVRPHWWKIVDKSAWHGGCRVFK